MKKQITLIAGHDDNGQQEQQTRAWLTRHSITVEEWNGLQVLTINNAEINNGTHTGEHCIGFDNAEGDPEESYLLVSLEPDPYDTRIEVEYSGSYSCACKGYACAECNTEIAAIARGENPYAHHTSVK